MAKWKSWLLALVVLGLGISTYTFQNRKHVVGYELLDSLSRLDQPLMDHLGYKQARIRLKNGLEAWIVHDPNSPNSATAVAFDVGSSDDPNEHMGLSHFLEHMVFLGSKSFKEEKGFSQFINGQGGTLNAYTHLDRTVYGFSCQPPYWEQACERMADMLKEPLLTDSASDRERNAIEEEMQKKLSLDSYRAWLVLCSQVNPQHPLHKLHIGNTKTLASTTSKELREWLQQRYIANRAKVFAISDLSIEQMANTIEKRFGKLAPGPVCAQPWAPICEGKNYDGEILIIPTLNADTSLQLNWALPDGDKSSPMTLEAFCELFSHPDHGSLSALLKERNWIYELEAASLECRSQVIVQVDLKLTPLGLENVRSIQGIVKNYLKFLSEHEWPSYLLSQWQNTQSIAWQTCIPKPSLEQSLQFASMLLDEPLQTFPDRAKWLTGEDFTNAQHVSKRLHDSSCLSLLLGPSKSLNHHPTLAKALNEDQGWLAEPWSSTHYKVVQWECDSSQSDETLLWQMPKANPFLPLQPPSFNHIATLSDFQRGEYDWGGITLIPNSYEAGLRDALVWSISEPQIQVSAHNTIRWLLISHILSQELQLTSFQADQACQSFELRAQPRGLKITFKGYSGDTQNKVIEEVADRVIRLKPNLQALTRAYGAVRDELQTLITSGPWESLNSRLSASIIQERFSAEELLQALEKLDLSTLQTNSSFWAPAVRFDLLAVSNRELTDWERFFDKIYLACGQTDPSTAYVLRENWRELDQIRWSWSHQREMGNLLVCATPLHDLQSHEGLERYLAARLLEGPLSSEMFHKIRTVKQMGYAVGSHLTMLAQRPVLLYYILSSSQNLPVLHEAVAEVTGDFLNNLRLISPLDFETQKQKLRHDLLIKPQSADAALARYQLLFWQLGLQEDFQDKCASMLENLTLERYCSLVAEILQGKKFTFEMTPAQKANALSKAQL